MLTSSNSRRWICTDLVVRVLPAGCAIARNVQTGSSAPCPYPRISEWRWKGKIKGTARRAFKGLSAHGFSKHAQKLLRAAVDANSMTGLVESRATYAHVRRSARESTYGVT
jgi:hypothetical protein